MKALLNHLSIKYKLALLTLLTMISLAVIILFSLSTLKHNLLEDREVKNQHLVEATTALVDHYYQQSQSGALSEAEAKEQALAAVNAMRYDGKEYFWINTLDYIMLSHPKAALIGQDIQGIKDPEGTQVFVEMVKVVQKQGQGEVGYMWNMPGADEPVDKISFVKLFKPWGWVVGTGIYIDDVNAIFWESTRNLLLTAGGFLVLVIWLSQMVSGNIYRPLSKMRAIMLQMSTSNDLTLTLKARGRDELGDIGRVFNQMIKEFRGVLGQVGASSSQLAAQAEELSAVTEQINQGMHTQREDIGNVDRAAAEMTAAINEVADNTHITLDATHSATEETNRCVKVLDDSAASITNLGNRVEQSAERIAQLKQSSENIGEIVSVIQSIAEQTNLLALNAAIEAARAGEQGRGFAVVADEVRTLASRTQDSTSNIKSVIETLQQGVEQSVKDMADCQEQAVASVALAQQAEESVVRMQEGMSKIADMNNMISSATEQQSATTQQVKTHIDEINVMAEQTTDSAAHTAQSSENLASMAAGLNDMITKFKV